MTAVVVGLGAFLAAYWLVVRCRILRAFSVAVASAGGFLLAAVVTTAAGAAAGVEGGGALFAGLFGALYGAVTVVALGRLSRSPA